MPDYRQRKSPRHPDADYAAEGSYFVTVCAQNRIHRFGAVRDGEMIHNPAGMMVTDQWTALSGRFPDIIVDCQVVMPNHIHAILVIDRTDAPSDIYTALPDAVGWFKSVTTNAYIRGVKADRWPSFEGRLWQRSYHDHIIRHPDAYNHIRAYVVDNPARWQQDVFYK